MVISEKKIRLKMMFKEDLIRRVHQLQKKYRNATGGAGRRFMLRFALRRQLRFYGKRRTNKKASTKRSAVWTVTSTSQATDSSPEGDRVEEEDFSEVESKENIEQEEDLSGSDKVEDTLSDQFLLPASFTMLLAAVKNENWNCVDYFLKREGVDPMEKIEAAEMAGAIILSKTSNNSELKRAFEYWRLALRLRQTEPELMQKTPLVLKSGQSGEWITPNQLKEVIDHSEEYQFQSFLVRLRICSNKLSKSWRDVLELHQDSFSDCIRDLKNQGRLVDLLDVLWATLETIKLFDFEPNYDLRSMIDSVVENLIMMLSQLQIDNPLLNAQTFKLPLEVLVAANDFVLSDDESDSIDSDNWSYCYTDHENHAHMSLVLQLFAFLAGLPYEILTPAIRQALRQLVLKNNFAHNKRTLLHMACENCYKAEDLSTIRLLLLSRANPNAADKYGDLPLHTLAYLRHGEDDVIQSAAHLLVEFGAQLERVNDDGETPANVWIRRHKPEAGWNDPPKWCLKPVTVPNLKSLCARVIRAQNLATDELPVTLIRLVEMREQAD